MKGAVAKNIPNRDNMNLTRDGFISLKKNDTYDNNLHKYCLNVDRGSAVRDQFFLS
jgi:hypothetical protein